MGSGRTELLQSLFGEYGVERSGEIEIDGEKAEIRSSRDAIALGWVWSLRTARMLGSS